MMRGEALEKSMFFMSDPDWYYYLDEDDDEQFPLLTDKAPPERRGSVRKHLCERIGVV